MKRKTNTPATIETRKARIESAWKHCDPSTTPALHLVWKASPEKGKDETPAPFATLDKPAPLAKWTDETPAPATIVGKNPDPSTVFEKRVNAFYHARVEKEYNTLFEGYIDPVPASVFSDIAPALPATPATLDRPTEGGELTPRPATPAELATAPEKKVWNAPLPYEKTARPVSDVFALFENAVRMAYVENPDPASIAEKVGRELYDLAPVPVFAVLKTLCNVGGKTEQKTCKTDPEKAGDGARIPRKLRRGLIEDLNIMRSDYFPDHEKVFIPSPTDPEKGTLTAPAPVPSLPLSDGSDLFQVACLTIWEETLHIINDRPADLANDFLTLAYTEKVVNKKVWIKDSPAPALVEKETSPIKKAIVAVRREIEGKRGIRFNNKFVYIPRNIGDFTDYIYMRVDRLTATLTGQENPTAKRAGKCDTLLAKMNLTKRQTEILKYRLLGFGKKAIATRLGCDPSTVKEHVQALQKKVRKLATDRPDLISPALLEKLNIA